MHGAGGGVELDQVHLPDLTGGAAPLQGLATPHAPGRQALGATG